VVSFAASAKSNAASATLVRTPSITAGSKKCAQAFQEKTRGKKMRRRKELVDEKIANENKTVKNIFTSQKDNKNTATFLFGFSFAECVPAEVSLFFSRVFFFFYLLFFFLWCFFDESFDFPFC